MKARADREFGMEKCSTGRRVTVALAMMALLFGVEITPVVADSDRRLQI